MIDLMEISDVLAPAACQSLRVALGAAEAEAAALLGGDVRSQVRRASRLALPPAAVADLQDLFMRRKRDFERHFGVALSQCEAPQCLRYVTGDFFVAHQDGNTPLVHDESRFRKVSAILFLSRQSEDPAPDTYGGGSLVLHGPYSGPAIRLPLAPPPGTLVAFRAETTHEVLPVTHGERFTIVTWFR
jgi:SM-20-related protein